MNKLILIALSAVSAMGLDLVPSATWNVLPGYVSLTYSTILDAKYWVRYDTYYDSAEASIWDTVFGINLWAALVQNTQITLFNFYQYTSIVELALYDVTPKVQLGIVRPDQAIVQMLPFDMHLLMWVDYTALSWTIVHQNNANLPITSLFRWLYQVGASNWYIPFVYPGDLQYYGNPSYYIDPFLSGDASMLPDWIFYHLVPAWGENLIPSLTGQFVMVNQWLLDIKTATVITPPGPTPCVGSAC